MFFKNFVLMPSKPGDEELFRSLISLEIPETSICTGGIVAQLSDWVGGFATVDAAEKFFTNVSLRSIAQRLLGTGSSDASFKVMVSSDGGFMVRQNFFKSEESIDGSTLDKKFCLAFFIAEM